MATLRSSRVSRAFQTSPIPPAPTRETTSYGPRRVPAETTVMSEGPARIIPQARLSLCAARRCYRAQQGGSGELPLSGELPGELSS